MNKVKETAKLLKQRRKLEADFDTAFQKDPLSAVTEAVGHQFDKGQLEEIIAIMEKKTPVTMDSAMAAGDYSIGKFPDC